MTTQLEGYEFYGQGDCGVHGNGDEPGEIMHVDLPSIQDCANLCSDHETCIAFEFETILKRSCELYDSSKGPIDSIQQNDEDYECHIKSDTGYDFFGQGDCGVNGNGDEPGEIMKVEVETFEECASLCSANDACIAFEFEAVKERGCEIYDNTKGAIDSIQQNDEEYQCYVKIPEGASETVGNQYFFH